MQKTTSKRKTCSIVLPSMSAGRELAEKLVGKLGDTRDSDVIIDGGRSVSTSPTFARTLTRVLLDSPVHTITLSRGTTKLWEEMHTEAARTGDEAKVREEGWARKHGGESRA